MARGLHILVPNGEFQFDSQLRGLSASVVSARGLATQFLADRGLGRYDRRVYDRARVRVSSKSVHVRR